MSEGARRALLLITLGVAVAANRRLTVDMEDFLLCGRRTGFIILYLTVAATFHSAFAFPGSGGFSSPTTSGSGRRRSTSTVPTGGVALRSLVEHAIRTGDGGDGVVSFQVVQEFLKFLNVGLKKFERPFSEEEALRQTSLRRPSGRYDPDADGVVPGDRIGVIRGLLKDRLDAFDACREDLRSGNQSRQTWSLRHVWRR